MSIEFYKTLNQDILKNQLIPYYNKNNESGQELKIIIICMNDIKFNNIVSGIEWDYELGDIYNIDYKLKSKIIDDIIIYFLLSKTIEYDSITAFPIYR